MFVLIPLEKKGKIYFYFWTFLVVCYYTVLVAWFVDLLFGWVFGFFGGRFVCLVDFLVA